MKICNLHIVGLFDCHDYDIHIDNDDYYIILTAPNGYGKTTILTLINALANADLFYFYNLPFKTISIKFNNMVELMVESKIKQSIPEKDSAHLDVSVEGSREITFCWKDTSGNESSFFINEKMIRDIIRRMRYYERNALIDINISHKMLHEFIRQNPDILKIMAQEQKTAFLLQIKSIKTVFIEAQRIYMQPQRIIQSNDRNRLPNYTIDQISEKICEKLRNARYNYLNLSQKINNQFIKHLLENDKKPISMREYNIRKSRLLEKASKLKQYHLIDDVYIPEFKKEHSKVLTAYIEDMMEKFKMFDDIYEKVQLFSELLENKQFVKKKVSFNVDKGLRVQTDMQKWIDPSDLSSGEQNIIIMLYYLVFEYDQNKILLIDEPEISLHVAWQFQYFNELERILSLNNGQAIVATHSPQIIGERWNNCYDLTEQRDNE